MTTSDYKPSPPGLCRGTADLSTRHCHSQKRMCMKVCNLRGSGSSAWDLEQNLQLVLQLPVPYNTRKQCGRVVRLARRRVDIGSMMNLCVRRHGSVMHQVTCAKQRSFVCYSSERWGLQVHAVCNAVAMAMYAPGQCLHGWHGWRMELCTDVTKWVYRSLLHCASFSS